MRLGHSLLVAITAMLMTTGCAGNLIDPDRFSTDGAIEAGGGGGGGGSCDTSTVESTLFKQKCGNAGCHGAQSPQNGLDLVTANLNGVSLADRILNGKSTACKTTIGGTQVDRPYVDRSNLDNSYFMLKMTQTAPACFSQMPLGAPLPSADTACVKQWLKEKAGL